MLNKKNFIKDLRNHGESPHDPRHDYTAMTEDILAFIDDHGLKEPILIGHSMYVIRDSCKHDHWLIFLRGAKTAMAVALRSPETVAKVVAVDNAPTDTMLNSSFATYVRGMKKIQEANVTRQSEADAILKDYEEVNTPGTLSVCIQALAKLTMPFNSHCPSVNSCSGTCFAHQRMEFNGFVSRWTSWADH